MRQYKNLQSFEAPETLRKIYLFINSEEGRGCGLEIPGEAPKPSKQKVAESVGSDLAEQIIPIFKLGHDSLIAVWLFENGASLENSPIVWLDSGGDPCEVFSESLEQLYGMLHYYDGTIYDILKSAIAHHEEPEEIISPITKFPVEVLERKAMDRWEKNPQLKNLHAFLENELNVPLDLGISAHIDAAYANHPKLSEAIF